MRKLFTALASSALLAASTASAASAVSMPSKPMCSTGSSFKIFEPSRSQAKCRAHGRLVLRWYNRNPAWIFNHMGTTDFRFEGWYVETRIWTTWNSQVGHPVGHLAGAAGRSKNEIFGFAIYTFA